MDAEGVFEMDGDESSGSLGYTRSPQETIDEEEDEVNDLIDDVDNENRSENAFFRQSDSKPQHFEYNRRTATASDKDNNNGYSKYAMSLPIDVPWNNHMAKFDDDDARVRNEESPETIEKNMKELAKSVYSDEIFGALPRRRLNTIDLVQSRPK